MTQTVRPNASSALDVMAMTIIEVTVIFFIQAEDGIRDWSVTGVQTCALPISCPGVLRQGLLSRPGQGRREALRLARQGAARIGPLRARALGGARQAVHRDDPSGRGRSGDAAAALRGRAALDQGDRDPAYGGEGRGAQARA